MGRRGRRAGAPAGASAMARDNAARTRANSRSSAARAACPPKPLAASTRVPGSPSADATRAPYRPRFRQNTGFQMPSPPPPPRVRGPAPGATLVATACLAACGGDKNGGDSRPAAGTTVSVALMETTDLHQNILGYDY